jgi:hypothetical protein
MNKCVSGGAFSLCYLIVKFQQVMIKPLLIAVNSVCAVV